MKLVKRVMLAIACVALIAVSWTVAATAKSDSQIQLELIEKADKFMEDKAYVTAVPYLEEAAGYDGEYTGRAEKLLKEAYINLLSTSGYARKYTNLLDKEMSAEDPSPDVFMEAAKYYESIHKTKQALSVLGDGVKKTGDKELTDYYESTRYQFRYMRVSYEDVTSVSEGSIQVKIGGAWGIADEAGGIIIPCEYDRITTMSNGHAAVMKDGEIFVIDSNNDRTALYHGDGTDVGPFCNGRLSIKTAEGWILTDSALNGAKMPLDSIGMYYGGVIPARKDGKWGFLAPNGSSWKTQPVYEEIICDELGRCTSGNAFFVRENGAVRLISEGEYVEGSYEDARPFAGGWAAVKKDGKWGFIDTEGNVKIEYQFEDALSFGQHLAAVKADGLWGYVSLRGEIVIDPVFQDARSFSGGSAAVKTDAGWQFITLLEYEEGYGI